MQCNLPCDLDNRMTS